MEKTNMEQVGHNVVALLDYWVATEQFPPPELNIKEPAPAGIIKIFQVNHQNSTLPWLQQQELGMVDNEKIRYVYNVYLGITVKSHVTASIKKILPLKITDYELAKQLDNTCLAAFVIGNTGKILDNSIVLPDYVIAINTIQKQQNSDEQFLKIFKQQTKQFEDLSADYSSNLNYKKDPISYGDLENFLEELLRHISWFDRKNFQFTAVIHCKETKAKKKKQPQTTKQDNKITKNTNAIVIEEKEPELKPDLINSFYIEDLLLAKDELKNQPNCVALQSYLGSKTISAQEDFSKDSSLAKKYSSPNRIPSTRWPGKGDYSLSIAQQIAVNYALKMNEGLFSVNGPPGTGKTTLLKDIVSEVVVQRASALAKLKSPEDAFSDSKYILVGTTKYKVWCINENLKGHELVVASSNNRAVENITKELPLSSSVDEKWMQNLDYFSSIATKISGNDEQSWGLIASVLGSSSNCNKFFNKFWGSKDSLKTYLKTLSRDGSDKPSDWKTIAELDRQWNKKFKKDWKKLQNNFNDKLQSFKNIQQELIAINVILEKRCNKTAATQITALELEQVRLNAEIKSKTDNITALASKTDENISMYDNEIHEQQQIRNDLNIHFVSLLDEKPHWLYAILELFSISNVAKEWRNERKYYRTKMAQCDTKLTELRKIISHQQYENTKQVKQIQQENTLLADALNTVISTITRYFNSTRAENKLLDNAKIKLGKFLPDQEYWQLSDENIQKSSPWMFAEFQKIRAELFVAALELQKGFILGAREQIVNNINTMQLLTTGHVPLPKSENSLRSDLWATFFAVVPVVSTTFASFARLFSGMGKNSIGWLLIDEAGQAVPPHAVGAIMRSKRAIIVGDPLQVEPVITLPQSLGEALRNYHQVDKRWDAMTHSVQMLADRANPLGTHIGDDKDAIWVGSPLRVHRRCTDPMYKVSNEIAYNNHMVYDSIIKRSIIEDFYPKSCWIDSAMPNMKYNGHWSEHEGEIAANILKNIISNTGTLPPLYIISPYASVINNMKRYLYKCSHTWSREGIINNSSDFQQWYKNSVGTIHTFQGRENKAVILLLGGNPEKMGAIKWAASKPNMLNVAITRAKNILIVVGNHEVWSKQTYFDTLAKALTVTIPDLSYVT